MTTPPAIQAQAGGDNTTAHPLNVAIPQPILSAPTPLPYPDLPAPPEAHHGALSDSVRQNERITAALILGDRDKYQGRARQCHRRSHPKSPECKTAEAQKRNADRRDLYLEVLQLLGFAAQMFTGETVADNDIAFKRVGEPQVDAQAIARMQQILQALGEVDKEHPVTIAARGGAKLEEATAE